VLFGRIRSEIATSTEEAVADEAASQEEDSSSEAGRADSEAHGTSATGGGGAGRTHAQADAGGPEEAEGEGEDNTGAAAAAAGDGAEDGDEEDDEENDEEDEEDEEEEDEAARKKRRKAEMAPFLAVVRALADSKHGYMFRKPVKDSEAPGYSEVVSHPMDLGTCKRNIEEGVTRSGEALYRDLNLIWDNTLEYNDGDEMM
jgi:hypothetical protein